MPNLMKTYFNQYDGSFQNAYYYFGYINKGGTVSRKPRKHFAPAKPFSINPYLKTEGCTPETSCMKGTYVHVLI